MSESHQALRDLQRELQRKIDRARPVFEQHERGELKVLTPEQQRMVDAYPLYLADIADVKAGKMPAHRPKPKVAAAAVTPPTAPAAAARPPPPAPAEAAQDEPEEPEAEGDDCDDNAAGSPGGKAKGVKRERASARKAKKREAAAAAKAGGVDPNHLNEHDRFVYNVAKATGKTRKALIDSHLNTLADRTRLLKLEKEYDDVCQLRRDILSGRVAQPTKLQQSRVQLAEGLKRDIESEQRALQSDGERHRIMLMAEVEEMEERLHPHGAGSSQRGASDPRVDEDEEAHAEGPVAAAAAPEEAVEAEKPQEEAKEEEKDEVAPEPEEKAEEAPALKPEPAAFEDAPSEAGSEPAPAAAKEAEEEENDAEVEAVAAADEAAPEEAEAETKQRTPTPKDPTPPPPPREPTPPPPPIDWSEVVITKNRRTIAPPAKRGASPTAGPRSGSPGRTGSPAAAGSAGGAAAAAGSSAAAAAAPTSAPIFLFSAEHQQQQQQGKTASSPAKGGKGGAAPAKGGKNGAKGSGSAEPTTTTGGSAFRQTAAARLQREFQDLVAPSPSSSTKSASSELLYVAATLVDDNLFRWAVNVSATEGPLVGLVIPLEIVFTEFYPQEPPLVRALVDLPHPGVIPTAQARNTLCMDHTAVVNPNDVTATKGWTPAYGAFSILSQLQNFFAAESFAKLEKALGARVFAQRVRTARVAIANFAWPATGHTPATPVPPVPWVNGPLRHAAEAVMIRGGALCCRAAGEGNAWRHSYGRSGEHRFRLTVRKGGAVVGVSTDGDREDQSQLGKIDGSWALDTSSGAVWSSGTEEKCPEAAAGYFPLPPGSTVDVTVRPAAGTIQFTVHGGAARDVTVETSGATGPFTPAYCLLSAAAAAELAFYPPNTTGLPPASRPPRLAGEGSDAGATDSDAVSPNTNEPTAAGATAAAAAAGLTPAASAVPRCAVTLRTAADGALICVGVEITKRHRTFLPAEMHTTSTYVAHDAFAKLSGQRGPDGHRFDVAIPMLLDSAHAQRALPVLKRTISSMCRNPLASTLYDPPFRPQLACAVFAELLRGVIRDVLHAKSPDYSEAFVLYCRLVHGFAALAAESPAIVKEARGLIGLGEVSSTVVFAVSTIVVEEEWPEVVQAAIRAEFAGREPESDEEGFALLRKALPKLLVGGAMARSVRFASLPRAVEVLSSNSGAPTAEIAQELLGALASRKSVQSWEALCDYFGVSKSAAEIASVV